MRKFYLKIEKEKWSWKEVLKGKGIIHEEGNRGCCVPDPLLHVQMKKGTAEHIPEGLRKEGGPPENWNTNSSEDGLEMCWTKVKSTRRRRRNVSGLCAASWLCEKKRFFQTEMNKKKVLTTEAQPGFFFSTDSILYFPAQVRLFFFFLYSEWYIYNFNLFI